MSGWVDPRPNDFSHEGLRARFKSLQSFLQNPTFNRGVNIGTGAAPSYDDTTGVATPPPFTNVDADTFQALDDAIDGLAADLATLDGDLTALDAALDALDAEVGAILPITTTKIADDAITTPKIAANQVTAGKIAANTITAAQIAADTITANEIAADTITANEIAADAITANELAANAVTASELAAINIAVGKYIRSTTYSAGVSGWAIDADGSAEFNDVVVRGEIEASEFRGAEVTNLCADPSFESSLDSWAALTALYPDAVVARHVTQPRTGTWSMRLSSSSSGTVGVGRTFSCSPGDIIYASGWVRKTTLSVAPNEFRNEVVLSINFKDGASYITFNNTRCVANASGWTFVELYAAAPVAETGIDSFEVEFSNSYNSLNYLYIDDVQVGFAPLLEVPYMVTNDDDSHQRARVLPHEIGFDGLSSVYPFGLRVDRYGDRDQMRLAGPYDVLGAAAQIAFTNDGSDTTMALNADSITFADNSDPAVEHFHIPHTEAAQVTGAGGTTTSATFAAMPVPLSISNFVKYRTGTKLIFHWDGAVINNNALGQWEVAIRFDGVNYPIANNFSDRCVSGIYELNGISPGTYNVALWWRRANGAGTVVQSSGGFQSFSVTETY